MSNISIPTEIAKIMLDFNTEDYVEEVNSRLTEEILDIIYKGLNDFDGYEQIFDTHLYCDRMSKTIFRKVYINNICSINSEFSHRGLLIEFVCFCIAYPNKQFYELFEYFTDNCRSTFEDFKGLYAADILHDTDIIFSFKHMYNVLLREINTSYDDSRDDKYTTCILKRLISNSMEDEYKRHQITKGVLFTYMDKYHSLLENITHVHELYKYTWMSKEEQIKDDNNTLVNLKSTVNFISDEMKVLDTEWFEECLTYAEKDIEVKFFNSIRTLGSELYSRYTNQMSHFVTSHLSQ